jgi:hypothetical protein
MKTCRGSRDEGRGLDGRIMTHAPFFLPLLPQGGEGRGEEANVYKLEPLTSVFARLRRDQPALSPFGRGEGVISVRCVCQDAPAACFESWNQTISSVAPSWAGNN